MAGGAKKIILAVDDTPENLDVIKIILDEEYTIKAAVNGPMALKIAESQHVDIILLDIMMPIMDGYEVCRRLKTNPKTADVPIIFVTAKDETNDETKGFAIGGVDYVTKPVNPAILKARIKTHLTLAERTKQLHELANHDSMTGLLNQRGFHDHLNREISVAKRSDSPLALIYFDLNGFKKLNDSKGHLEGDTLLEWVGKSVMETIRGGDFGCRYGGDEFCIIMPHSDVGQACTMYNRLIEQFDSGKTQNITFSAGIAQTGPSNFVDYDQLIKEADTLMYLAKARSKKEPGHYCNKS